MPNFVERFFFVLLLFCDKLFLSYKSISFKRIFFASFRSEYFSKQTDYIWCASMPCEKTGETLWKISWNSISYYSADLLLRQYKRCLYHSAFWKKPGTVPQISRCIYPLYVFIPLDIFSQTVHNNGIRNLLEAWLVFLSIDSPELMISLITEYPKFKVMYEHLYYICQNVERMMEMYSAELKILDRKHRAVHGRPDARGD